MHRVRRLVQSVAADFGLYGRVGAMEEGATTAVEPTGRIASHRGGFATTQPTLNTHTRPAQQPGDPRAPLCYNDGMLINRCAGCSEPGTDLCRRCRFALVASRPVVTPAGIVAATEFAGLGRDLVVGLKYRNRRHLAVYLAEQLSRRLDPTQIDVVTWAPTSGRRSRRRGYDQAELLARALAARWRKPCRRMLFRRHGAPQTGQTRALRLVGPEFASRPMSPVSWTARPTRLGPRVLVVDDVVTTGATLHAAREALLAAGARSVVMAAVAATPDVQTSPARRSAAAIAAAESSSTRIPNIPTRSAAATLVSTSSRKAERPAVALSLVRASS